MTAICDRWHERYHRQCSPLFRIKKTKKNVEDQRIGSEKELFRLELFCRKLEGVYPKLVTVCLAYFTFCSNPEDSVANPVLIKT